MLSGRLFVSRTFFQTSTTSLATNVCISSFSSCIYNLLFDLTYFGVLLTGSIAIIFKQMCSLLWHSLENAIEALYTVKHTAIGSLFTPCHEIVGRYRVHKTA